MRRSAPFPYLSTVIINFDFAVVRLFLEARHGFRIEWFAINPRESQSAKVERRIPAGEWTETVFAGVPFEQPQGTFPQRPGEGVEPGRSLIAQTRDAVEHALHVIDRLGILEDFRKNVDQLVEVDDGSEL